MSAALFDPDFTEEDLATILEMSAQAARLTRLAVAGVLADAEYNRIKLEDLELIQQCAEAADNRAWQARKLFDQQQTSEPTPPGVVPIRRTTGEGA